ncbi:hypothetical protein RGQ29_029011 [Quercus rubra]|uniref:MBD domain-containing protein n=1 Tax=Quercus rubra TaxID=3512 RepID=A0AAN7INF7_QUERU|nr:hypothetical protein RGQ29_029011 [Quercus rubra]
MERSGNQQRSHAQANNRNNHIHTLLSPLTWSTIYKVLQNRRRGVRDGTRCTFHDNSCNGFGWLLPGWVAEERVKQTGRVYRYYYDPSGRLYHSQHEVTNAWEALGIVVVDK